MRIKWSQIDWNTEQGHLLRSDYFEVCWVPLKLTDSLNQHLTQYTPRMIKKQQVSNGSLKNLHSTAPIDLLDKMIVYAVRLIKYKYQGIITASLLLL